MHWRLYLLLGNASLLCLLILTQHASNVQAQATVDWFADHEEGSEEDWYGPGDGSSGGGEFNNGCAGVSPVHGFGRNPSGADPWPFSLVLTIATPCGGVAQSGARMFRFQEPQQYPDLYYKVWYFLPQVFTLTDPANPWWIVMAWKSTTATPSRDDPFFSINVASRPDGNMFLSLYEYKPYDPSNAQGYGQTLVDLPVAKWFYIEAYYQSRGDATGRVTVWQGDEVNRTLLWDLQDVQTRYPDAEGGTAQWAVTNYSNGVTPVPAQFAIDDAQIRTP
jgi:hypothetical protein